jgi:hypothetical protein
LRAALLALLVPLAPSIARADGPYEGEWRRGAMTITVSIDTWGPDCGARPVSTTVPARGTVNVTQDGDHLTFGGGRSTRSCWSDNPAVRRVSNTVSSGTWRIVCRTPADDSRQETGTYTLRASGSDTIEFRDVTEYDWTLNESHCRATTTTTQTFTRVGGGTATPDPTPDPTPEPTPEPEPAPSCTPGAPARIALRPASTDVEPGGRVCFNARVVDASGCPIRGLAPTLVLRAPEGREGALRGACFEAASSAAAGEGEFAVLASSGELRAEARVRVHTMDLSDLIARRAESGSVVEDPGAASAGEAAGVAARSDAPAAGIPWWQPALAALVGLLFVIGSALLLVTRRRKRDAQLAEARARAEERAAVSAAASAAAAAAAAAAADAAATAEPAGSASAKICPTCRRGYGPNETRCARDGAELVPYATFVQKSERELVCPKCGTRYPGSTRFCGKDGSTLDPA